MGNPDPRTAGRTDIALQTHHHCPPQRKLNSASSSGFSGSIGGNRCPLPFSGIPGRRRFIPYCKTTGKTPVLQGVIKKALYLPRSTRELHRPCSCGRTRRIAPRFPGELPVRWISAPGRTRKPGKYTWAWWRRLCGRSGPPPWKRWCWPGGFRCRAPFRPSKSFSACAKPTPGLSAMCGATRIPGPGWVRARSSLWSSTAPAATRMPWPGRSRQRDLWRRPGRQRNTGNNSWSPILSWRNSGRPAWNPKWAPPGMNGPVRSGTSGRGSDSRQMLTPRPAWLGHCILPPAVCGQPRGAARDYILGHENFDREYYCGFLGEVGRTGPGSFRLFVNLRCLQLRENSAYIYTGGGITADSDPAAEWDEIQHKSLTVLRALQNSPD